MKVSGLPIVPQKACFHPIRLSLAAKSYAITCNEEVPVLFKYITHVHQNFALNCV